MKTFLVLPEGYEPEEVPESLWFNSQADAYTEARTRTLATNKPHQLLELVQRVKFTLELKEETI